jgi:hypothetical protein
MYLFFQPSLYMAQHICKSQRFMKSYFMWLFFSISLLNILIMKLKSTLP